MNAVVGRGLPTPLLLCGEVPVDELGRVLGEVSPGGLLNWRIHLLQWKSGLLLHIMINNKNTPLAGPLCTLKGILTSHKGCLTLYDHQASVQVTEGVIMVTHIGSNTLNAPQPTPLLRQNPSATIVDLSVTSGGKILTLSQVPGGQFEVVAYQDGDSQVIPLNISAPRFFCKQVAETDVVYVFEGDTPDFYSEIVVFSAALMKVSAIALLADKVLSCHFLLQKVHILVKKSLNIYRIEGRALAFETSHPVDLAITGFLKVFDTMIYYSHSSIQIFKEDFREQTITEPDIISVVPITLGMLVLCKGQLKHFQKWGDRFLEVDHLNTTEAYTSIEVSRKENLVILQTETGLAHAVFITPNTSDETDRNGTFGEKVPVREEEVRVDLACVGGGSNPYLVLVKEESRQLLIFSKNTLERLLIYQLDSSMIYDCQLESHRPHMLLSTNGVIKKYCMLYNKLEEVTQVAVRARRMIYSPSNTFVACLVGSQKYCKVQLFRSEDLKELGVLWVGQEVSDILWSNNDLDLFAIIGNGYERWSLLDMFKSKSKFHCKESILRTVYNREKGSLIALTSDKTMLTIRNDTIESRAKVQDGVDSIVSINGLLLMSHHTGVLSYGNVDSRLPPSIIRLFTSKFNVLVSTHNQVICSSGDKTSVMVLRCETEEGSEKDVVLVERNLIKDLTIKAKSHEEQAEKAFQKMQGTVKGIQEKFKRMFEDQQKAFLSQIKSADSNLEEEVSNKRQLQRLVKEIKERYENEQMQAVEQLEKLYDRKITILTNNLMTENELSMRNTLSSFEKIQALQDSHAMHVSVLNKQFTDKMKQLKVLDLGEQEKRRLLEKQYEERLAQQYQDSEQLLNKMQTEYEDFLVMERRTCFQWQEKHKSSMIEKFTTEEMMAGMRVKNNEAEKTIRKLTEGIEDERRKTAHCKEEIQSLSKLVAGLEVQLDRERAHSFELSQTNQVLNFKILESREAILPKQRQLEELKEKFNTFEGEFQRNLHQAGEQTQLVTLLKKESSIAKKNIIGLKDLYHRELKNYVDLIYSIKEIVTEHSPDQWNSKISLLYEELRRRGWPEHGDTSSNVRKNKVSIVEEIDRSKNHLEHCLNQVISSNSKIQKRKSHELTKKLKENADLLHEINELRTRLKRYEQLLPVEEKDFKIKRRSLTIKTEPKEPIKAFTSVITEEEIPAKSLFQQSSYLQKARKSKGLDSTSIDFGRQGTKRSQILTRNTVKKGICLGKTRQTQPKQEEMLDFLRRKLQLQEKIINSLRAKVNGVDI